MVSAVCLVGCNLEQLCIVCIHCAAGTKHVEHSLQDDTTLAGRTTLLLQWRPTGKGAHHMPCHMDDMQVILASLLYQHAAPSLLIVAGVLIACCTSASCLPGMQIAACT
jgi:hypothetical protein